jgi:hypothetical protein
MGSERWRVLGTATVLAACAVLPACGQDPDDRGRCQPSLKQAEPAAPPDVTRVDIYWDVSQSMRTTVAPIHDPRGRPQAPPATAAAIYVLWDHLARHWVRAPTVNDVHQITMGNEIQELHKIERLPAFDAPWTNLPVVAQTIAHYLGEHDDAAALVVSDMWVDPPRERVGDAVCGDVKAPAGNRDVPALFGQCLVQSWKPSAPTWTTVYAVIIHEPVAAADDRRPLFVLVFSRNPDFSRALVNTLVDKLGQFKAQAVLLAEQRPTVPALPVGKCSYRRRPDIVARHVPEDGTRECSFNVASASGTHKLRCPIVPSSEATENPSIPELVTAHCRSVTGGAGFQVSTTQISPDQQVLDLAVDLTTWKMGSHDVELQQSFEWELRRDLDAQLTNWIGGAWSKQPDPEPAEYVLEFSTIVRLLHRSMAAPMPGGRVLVHYER